jgi:hypothetical protein
VFTPCELADDWELLVGRIVTSRYQSWQPGHGVPIQVTIGTPKFWGGRRQLVDLRIAAPWGLMDPELPTDECRRLYVQRLDDRADRIVGGLAAIARQNPGERLVLLCFEDVEAGQVCHRRWFAEWFEDRYGIEVPELTAENQQMTFDAL